MAPLDVVSPDIGGSGMATGDSPYPGDLDSDCTEILLESAVKTHEALITEVSANGESAHSIVRHSGARKFNREDPLEGAAAAKVLKLPVETT